MKAFSRSQTLSSWSPSLGATSLRYFQGAFLERSPHGSRLLAGSQLHGHLEYNGKVPPLLSGFRATPSEFEAQSNLEVQAS